jgi:chitin disaccharide deacetylase
MLKSRSTPWLVFAALALAAPPARAADAASPSVAERLGHPANARLLVLHADDLGMSHSVNRATFEALEKGWVTSASILVPCPWFPEAAAFARTHSQADLGIHLALNSEWTTLRWGPVSPSDQVPTLLDEHGFLRLDTPQVTAQAKPAEVERELRAQVERARAAGVRLSHLDSHMGALFGSEDFLNVYCRVGADYGLPVLLERTGERAAAFPEAAKESLVDRVLGIDPGVTAAGWRAAYEKMLEPLPPGVYELIVHLAYDDDEMRGATADHPDWGAAWRQQDLDLVKSPEFRSFLDKQGFIRVGWGDLAKAMVSGRAK